MLTLSEYINLDELDEPLYFDPFVGRKENKMNKMKIFKLKNNGNFLKSIRILKKNKMMQNRNNYIYKRH